MRWLARGGLAAAALLVGVAAAGPAAGGATGATGATGAVGVPAERGVPAWFPPMAAEAQAEFGVPAPLLAAVAEVESDFTPTAVGPPVPGGPALGLMQFLPSSWRLFTVVPGATPFDPGPAVLAAAHHLRVSGTTAAGWDVRAALFGYNHSTAYVARVLAVAAGYGYREAG